MYIFIRGIIFKKNVYKSLASMRRERSNKANLIENARAGVLKDQM